MQNTDPQALLLRLKLERPDFYRHVLALIKALLKDK